MIERGVQEMVFYWKLSRSDWAASSSTRRGGSHENFRTGDPYLDRFSMVGTSMMSVRQVCSPSCPHLHFGRHEHGTEFPSWFLG
jgi:hypothetical protein